MDRGFNGDVGVDGDRGQGSGVRPLLHVDVVVRRRDRADFHVYTGAQPVEAVRATGGEAPEGRAPEGRDRDFVVEELPLQPPGQGGAGGAPGIPVPAGERWRAVA